MDRPRDRQQSSAQLATISSSVSTAGERVSIVPCSELDSDAPLVRLGQYRFKPARTDAELDQVDRLNYDTFVREVAQHGDPGTGRLIDKFHHENTYLIATRGDDVVGMAAAHDSPPFSIADRLPDPDVIERPGDRPLEVRLLAVRPDCRRGPIFYGRSPRACARPGARPRSHTAL